MLNHTSHTRSTYKTCLVCKSNELYMQKRRNVSRLSHCCFIPIVSPSLCLAFLLTMVMADCLRRIFRAPAEYYPALMESCECESADDTDAEQLATADCTSAQQCGARTDRLAAVRLQKKCHRAEETTEEHTARLQSYNIYHSAPYCCASAPRY